MSTETSTHQPANPYPLDDNVSGDTGFREQKSVLASRVSEVLHAYLALTKPRIIELLLITTVPAMVAAQRGIPRLESIVATVLGGTLSAGGANAINNYFDRDIDERMARTQRRPLPSHKIIPRDALVFGIVLGTAGFLVLGAFTNWLAAFLATAALVFYVVVYTLILKRRTPQNIV
ncbi:MAG: protoheme IX farnesyltransferase, partial [Acidimicrobiia bacterium]